MNGSPRPIRVMCVDDNDLLAEALRRRVQQETCLEWAGFVSDVSSIAERIDDARPDVVLMDIDMPGVDTFILVERLAASHPDVRVLMFSGHVHPAYLDRSLDCGAWGYLSKNEDTADLIAGIRRAAAGEIVLSREVEESQRTFHSS